MRIYNQYPSLFALLIAVAATYFAMNRLVEAVASGGGLHLVHLGWPIFLVWMCGAYGQGMLINSDRRYGEYAISTLVVPLMCLPYVAEGKVAMILLQNLLMLFAIAFFLGLHKAKLEAAETKDAETEAGASAASAP